MNDNIAIIKKYFLLPLLKLFWFQIVIEQIQSLLYNLIILYDVYKNPRNQVSYASKGASRLEKNANSEI